VNIKWMDVVVQGCAIMLSFGLSPERGECYLGGSM
jgi:hypothetical protein